MRRVVVTGMGAITPLGLNVDEFWNGIKEGKHGFGEITKFDASEYKAHLAGEVKGFVGKEYMDVKAAKRMELFCQYAVAAAKEAIEQSGYSLEEEDPYRVGCSIGSGIGSLQTIEREHKKLLEKGPNRVNPLMVPMMISNMAAGNVSIQFGLKGKSINVVTACASGTHCIGEAYRTIQFGDADIMGADMVIFSGGKTLCGPQDSGLILGKREYIQNCRKFGSPAHGICRSCKTSREAMAGLYMAVKQYCSLDHEKNKEEMNRRNITIQNKIKGKDSVLRTRIVPKGPVGQDYPRLFCELKQKGKAEETAVKMKENGIFIGSIPQENTIYISPLNLTDEEAVIVGDRLSELL